MPEQPPHHLDRGLWPVLLVLLALAAPCHAAGEQDADAGKRSGVVFDGSLIADLSRVVDGGIERREAVRVWAWFGAEVDLQQIVGLDGTQAYLSVQGYGGRNGSEDAGDLQVYSNIDAEDFFKLAEVWVQWSRERLRIKAGRTDANTEFAAVESGGEFIHSSPGFSPTLATFPSYPILANSLGVFYRPTGRFELAGAVYDSLLRDEPANRGSRPLLLIGQASIRWGGGGKGRLAAGAWRESGKIERFDGSLERDPSGSFFLLEQPLGGAGGAVFFAQYAETSPGFSAVTRHLGAGVSAAGLFGRADDVQGVMVSRADLSPFDPQLEGGHETAVEVYYGRSISPRVTLKPNLQYIRHPSGLDEVDDAVIVTLRVELSL